MKVAVSSEDAGFETLSAAAEAAAPAEAVAVVARDLTRRLDADRISFLLLDIVGQELVRLGGVRSRRGEKAERLTVAGSVYEEVLRDQRPCRRQEADGRRRVIVPVTNRGDPIGVLELTVPSADERVVRLAWQAARALAYFILADRRFTDLYHWGQRTIPISLAAEIQHQLLPSASAYQGDGFAVAAALVPADDVGGDTYDYAVDRETLHVSITDAMGHGVDSALLATLLVAALRRARRAGDDPVRQAEQAQRAIIDHGRDAFATGLLLRIDLDDGACRLINAGHPWPLRLRDGEVRPLPLTPQPPFGISCEPYRVQYLRLRRGDRLILITDGMQERAAAAADLPALVEATGRHHPRQAVQALTGAVRRACDGRLPDDATVVCLDWYGPVRPAGEPGPATGPGGSAGAA